MISGFATALQYVETAEFTALAGACAASWRRSSSRADAWVSGAFGSLAAIGVVGLFAPSQLTHSLGVGSVLFWFLKIALCVLCAFPYLLVRFLDSLERIAPRTRTLADVSVATAIVATLAMPRLYPASDHHHPAWVTAYVGLFAVEWGWLSGYACLRLWMTGRGQPSVVRRRMEILSFGSLVLVGSLIPALVPSNGSADSGAHIASEVIGVLAGLLFYIGFAPPAALRSVWRRPEARAMRNAEMRLMTGPTAAGVALSVLPQLPGLFGTSAALLLDRAGHVIGSTGIDGDELAAMVAAVSAVEVVSAMTPSTGVVTPAPGVVAVPMRNGVLAVSAGPYMPFFGRDEFDTLQTLAAFVDLALARAELFDRERSARVALEAAHQELEDLVYSLSHDLKSPLISLLGYLDYLKLDCGDALGENGLFYADRMTVAATYMTSLIEDLLTLSRVGRTQTELTDVDMGAIARDVAAGVRADVSVGALPVVRFNPVRAREVFTNLIENAIRHGEHDRVAITISSHPTDQGGVCIVVADNGVGIPVAQQEKVFGIFERLKPGDGGTGIGLAMCRKIIEQAGGVIDVDPTYTSGAAFRITLPPASLSSRPPSPVGVAS